MIRIALASAMALLAFGAERVQVETHRDGFDAHMTRVKNKGWRQIEAPALTGTDPEATLEVLLAIKQSNTKELEETLLEVSDPASPRYGQWLALEEVDALVAPASASVTAVTSWLASHNIQAEKGEACTHAHTVFLVQTERTCTHAHTHTH